MFYRGTSTCSRQYAAFSGETGSSGPSLSYRLALSFQSTLSEMCERDVATRMEHSTAALKTQQRSSRFGLWWTLSANIFVFLLMLEAYAVPPGTYVRPIGLAFWIICLGTLALLALPFAFFAVWRSPKRFWPWFTIVLSLTPLPLSSFMLHHAASVRGFYILP